MEEHKEAIKRDVIFNHNYQTYFIWKHETYEPEIQQQVLTFSPTCSASQTLHFAFNFTDTNSNHTFSGDYKLGESYKINASIRTCVEEILDTSLFQCHQPSHPSNQSVHVDLLCNDKNDCYNGKDEMICYPQGKAYNLLYYSFLAILCIFVISGSLLFLYRISKWEWNNPSSLDIKCSMKNVQGVTKELVRVLNGINGTATNMFRWQEHSLLVNRLYHPCQKSETNKNCLMLIYTLSNIEDFKLHCFSLIDEIFCKEYVIHRNSPDSMKCLMWNNQAHSFLSSWINDVYERNQCISKFKHFIINTITFVYENMLFQNRLAILYGKNCLDMIFAFLRVCVFYFDVFRDLWLIFQLYYMDSVILVLKECEDRYSTVGGINYTYLIIYMLAVTFLSETWIFAHAYKRTKHIRKPFGIESGNKYLIWMIMVFPIHFAFFGIAYINIKNRELFYKLENIFKKKSMDNETVDDEHHLKALEIATRLEKNYRHQFLLNKFLSELETIESCGERELQLVAQSMLMINGRFFPRIRTLFSGVFGMDILHVFAINFFFTILSITRNVIRYRNAKRYPLSPGMIGTILQFLTVGALMTAKIFFISIAVSNAAYFHIIGHILKILIVYIVCKCFGSRTTSLFDAVIATSNTAAFFTQVAAPNDSNMSNYTVKKYLKMYGGFFSTMLLEGLSCFIYLLLGNLIRYLQRLGLINPSNIPDRVFENDPWQYVLRKYLVEFDVGRIIFWMICCFWLFSLFGYIYYQKGHPKRKAKDRTTLVNNASISVALGSILAEQECIVSYDMRKANIKRSSFKVMFGDHLLTLIMKKII